MQVAGLKNSLYVLWTYLHFKFELHSVCPSSLTLNKRKLKVFSLEGCVVNTVKGDRIIHRGERRNLSLLKERLMGGLCILSTFWQNSASRQVRKFKPHFLHNSSFSDYLQHIGSTIKSCRPFPLHLLIQITFEDKFKRWVVNSFAWKKSDLWVPISFLNGGGKRTK